MSMNFPLFDAKELEARAVDPSSSSLPSSSMAVKPEARQGSACAVERAQPSRYVRDVLGMLLVIAVLGGLVVLSYYLPTWL